jgi:hypothetical protein
MKITLFEFVYDRIYWWGFVNTVMNPKLFEKDPVKGFFS